jgi:hypothetical protein
MHQKKQATGLDGLDTFAVQRRTDRRSIPSKHYVVVLFAMLASNLSRATAAATAGTTRGGASDDSVMEGETSTSVWKTPNPHQDNASSLRKTRHTSSRKNKIFDMDKGKKMKKCMDKTKGNKKESKTKQNKRSDGTEEGGCTVCDRLFRDFTASSTSYEVLRIDGFNFDDVSFNVSRLSYQTLFDMSIPYTSEEELGNIGNAFDSIAISDVVDPEDYRRVLSIDIASTLSECEGGVYPILNLTFPESVQELCVEYRRHVPPCCLPADTA